MSTPTICVDHAKIEYSVVRRAWNKIVKNWDIDHSLMYEIQNYRRPSPSTKKLFEEWKVIVIIGDWDGNHIGYYGSDSGTLKDGRKTYI